jgi:hypothetical protein
MSREAAKLFPGRHMARFVELTIYFLYSLYSYYFFAIQKQSHSLNYKSSAILTIYNRYIHLN